MIRTVVCACALLLSVVMSASSYADIYESDWASGSINRFDSGGSKSTFATGLSNIAGLAFDTGGNLFVADTGAGTVYKFTPAGTKSTFATGLGNPYGMAFDTAGNLYVSDSGVGRRLIYKFTSAGIRSTFATGFSTPSGLEFDSSGNLLVADFNRIMKVTPLGVASKFADASNGAVDLAVAANGDIYLTDDQIDVWKYTPTGSLSRFGTVPDRSGPITFDDLGNLYVGDRGVREIGEGAIYKFSTTGVRSTVASGLNDPQGLAFIVPEPSMLFPSLVGVYIFQGRRRRAGANC